MIDSGLPIGAPLKSILFLKNYRQNPIEICNLKKTWNVEEKFQGFCLHAREHQTERQLGETLERESGLSRTLESSLAD